MEFFSISICRPDGGTGYGVQVEFGNGSDPDTWRLYKWVAVGELGSTVAECIGLLSDWSQGGPLQAMTFAANDWR